MPGTGIGGVGPHGATPGDDPSCGPAFHLELVGRIDSVELGGGGTGIRTTFESVPDAPVSKFVLTMKGGDKGLIVNSTDLCSGRHRATVKMDAHNGTIRDLDPVLRADCGKGGKRKRVAQR